MNLPYGIEPVVKSPPAAETQRSVLCCVSSIVFTWGFQWRGWLLSSIAPHTDQHLTQEMLCAGLAALGGWQTEPEIEKLQHMRLTQMLHGSAATQKLGVARLGSFISRPF